jgi:hypothetical protein
LAASRARSRARWWWRGGGGGTREQTKINRDVVDGCLKLRSPP